MYTKPIVQPYVNKYAATVSAGAGEALVGSFYDFNGTDQFVTIPTWATLGDYDLYGEVSFSFKGTTDGIIDLPPPVGEFGRVGAVYHDGPIWNLRLTDRSPFQGENIKTTSTATIPAMDMTGGFVSFWYIHPGDGDIVPNFLSSVAGVLTLDANANNLSVDDGSYSDEVMTVGQMYYVSFNTTGGTLSSVVSTSGMWNLNITGTLI